VDEDELEPAGSPLGQASQNSIQVRFESPSTDLNHEQFSLDPFVLEGRAVLL